VKKVELRVGIQRSVEDVFAYTSDYRTMPEWRGDISEAEQLTDGPLAVGTRIRAGVKALGRPIDLVVEVTELEPGVRFGYRPVSGPLRTHNVYTFEPDAGGTVVTLTDEFQLGGIFRLFEPLLAGMVRRQFQANLGRLKAILEAQPAKGA
jgi:uncharacterized membrane protein